MPENNIDSIEEMMNIGAGVSAPVVNEEVDIGEMMRIGSATTPQGGSLDIGPPLTPVTADQRRELDILAIQSSVGKEEIDLELSNIEREFGALARWRLGDEGAARSIAEDTYYKGVKQAGPGREQGILESLTRAPVREASKLIPSFAPDFAIDFKRRQESLPPGEGTAGLIGEGIVQAAIMSPAFLVPQTAPFIFGAQIGTHAEQVFEETNSVQAALGAAAVELVSEYLGYKVIGKIGKGAASALGNVIQTGNAKQFTKVLASFVASAGVEIIEEEAAMALGELNLYAAGQQDLAQSLQNMRDKAGPTAIVAGTAGVLLTTPAILSPSGRMHLRAALDSRDEARVRSTLISAGISAKDADSIVSEMGGFDFPDTVATEDLPDVNVDQEIHEASTEDLVELSETVGEAISQAKSTLDQVVEEGQTERPGEVADQLDEEEIQALETLKKQADDEISQRATNPPPVEEEQKEGVPKAIKKKKPLAEVFGIKPTGGGVPGAAKINVHKAFAESLAKSQRDKTKAAVSIEREKGRKQIAALKTKLQEARRNFIESRREAVEKAAAKGQKRVDAVRAQYKLREKTIDQIRKDLLDTINEQMPKGIRASMLTPLAKVKTAIQLNKAIERISELVTKYEAEVRLSEAVSRLESLMKSVKPASMSAALRAKAEAILDRIQKSSPSKDTKKKLESRKGFIDRGGKVTQKAAKELERLEREGLRKIPVDELETMADELHSLDRQNKLRKNLILAGKKRDRQKAINSIVGEITTNLERLKDIPETGSLEEDKPPGIIKLQIDKYEATTTNDMALLVGGGYSSGFYRVFVDEIFRGQTKAIAGYYETSDAFAALLEEHGIDPQAPEFASWSQWVAGPKGSLSKWLSGTDLTATTVSVEMSDKSIRKLTYAEIMGIVAVLRDPDRYDHVVMRGRKMSLARGKRGDGFTVNESDLAKLESLLDHRQVALIDWMHGQINGPLRKQMAEWSLEVLGQDITSDGYFPSHSRAEDPGQGINTVSADNFVTETMKRMGFLKYRVQSTESPILVEDVFQTFFRYVKQSHGIVNMDKAVAQARSVLLSPEVNTALLNSKDGGRIKRRVGKVLDIIVQDIAGGSRDVQAIEGSINKLIHNATRAYLGLNLRVILGQPTSIIMAERNIPTRFLIQAVNSMFDSGIDTEIKSDAPQLRWRRNHISTRLVTEGATIVGTESQDVRNKRDYIMGSMMASDHMVTRMAWAASKLMAEESGLTGDKARAFVADMATRTVLETQASGNPLFMTGLGIESSLRPAVRIFSMFRSQISKDLGNLIYAIQSGRGAGVAGSRLALRAAVRVFLAHTLWTAMAQGYDIVLRGVDDDEAERLLTGMARDFLSLPIGGDYVYTALMRTFLPNRFAPDPRNPISGAMVDGIRASASIVNDLSDGSMDDDRAWERLISSARMAAALTGAPVGAILRDARNVLKRNKRRNRGTDGGVMAF